MGLGVSGLGYGFPLEGAVEIDFGPRRMEAVVINLYLEWTPPDFIPGFLRADPKPQTLHAGLEALEA